LREVSVNEQRTRTDAGDRLLSIREIPLSKLGKLRRSSVRDVNDYVARRRVVPPASRR
jgi:hypothetical protein